MRSEVLFVSLGLAACGSVKATSDAQVTRDSPVVHDSPIADASHDAFAGPTPRLHWDFEGNTDNTGAVSGFTLATPAGISYVTGKVGMAASFGMGQYSNVAGMKQVIGTYAKVTIAFWLMEPGTLQNVAVLDCWNRSTGPFGGVQLGFLNNTASLCVATTSNSSLGTGCASITAPTANAWHHWIIRYDGTGTGAGQGAPVTAFVDGTLALTVANDVANDPVFTTTGMSDTLYVGASNTLVDDVRVYNQVFTPAEQCTEIIGGTLNGTTCVLP